MIIDCHGHLAHPDFLPEAFFHGWGETLQRSLPGSLGPEKRQRLSELFMEMREDRRCEALLKQMDEAGIGQMVLLVVDFGIAFGLDDFDIEGAHLAHKEILDASERFIGFAGVDPRRGKAGLELFKKAVGQWGFKGLKVYPPCGFSPSDPSLFPYYDICSQLGLPVLVHTGPTASTMPFRFSQPIEIDEAALRFPTVNFILGHAGVTQYRESGLLAEYRPNLHLDLSGFQGEIAKGGFGDILAWHLSRGLGRRLLFGTDWPIHRFFGSQAKWVGEIRKQKELGILTEADLDNIFHANFGRLYQRGGA